MVIGLICSNGEKLIPVPKGTKRYSQVLFVMKSAPSFALFAPAARHQNLIFRCALVRFGAVFFEKTQ
jgi:hypothetical protein